MASGLLEGIDELGEASRFFYQEVEGDFFCRTRTQPGEGLEGFDQVFECGCHLARENAQDGEGGKFGKVEKEEGRDG